VTWGRLEHGTSGVPAGLHSRLRDRVQMAWFRLPPSVEK
jgi:hypothetical protein